MLINDVGNEISDLIASMQGNNTSREKITDGIYEIGSFGGSMFLPDFDHYPDLDHDEYGEYGVCDNYLQILDIFPILKSSKERKFLITLTPVRKKNQSSDGGWRWHKWGAYIGTKNPQCEYLYDEPDIDLIYCYHIYEKK